MGVEQKILTITIPCYNSEKYMTKCIESLLKEKDRIEIIIVDDGSKDSTGAIADAYHVKYPKTIRTIHKENGGHGDAINAGLAETTGKYFKVIDSDDWVDQKAFHVMLDKLEELERANARLDLMITNFVYYKIGARHHKVMRYKSAFPQNQIFTWDDKIRINHFQYILMHSVTYRTEILRSCNLHLPKHTFYVDNIFLFQPLPLVKRMYYLDVNLYQYFIGREDQSVNEKVMISRIDQQIKVNKILMDVYTRADIPYAALDRYMLQYFDMMMCVASVMLIIGGEEEQLRKKKELWQYLYKKNKTLYKKMRYGLFGIWMNLPGKGGRWLSKMGYKVMQKVFGFN